MKDVFIPLCIATIILLSGCGNEDTTTSKVDAEQRDIVPLHIDFQSTAAIVNKAAYVTSQCYTKTVDAKGVVHNPCFTCHINSIEPNYVDDWDLQESNKFSEYTKVNHFTNLFKDRTNLVSLVSDDAILKYVKQNNYMQNEKIVLAQKLANVPSEWDVNSDGKWGGYTPDCYFNFDDEGFDRAPNGDYTLWRAFAYYPFLGTFWPTNGSTDDVLIRLNKVFAQDVNATLNLEVYKLNLSIVESLIKQKDIVIDAVDETKYGIDLNQDGVLGRVNKIVFQWKDPTYDSATGKITNFSMSYVGKAKELLASNEYLIAPGLYPKDTEFLHSVRYIDVDKTKQTISMAPRMKELRYAKKLSWVSYSKLSNVVLTDIKEKDMSPDALRTIVGSSEVGLLNGMGWIYQGFIEDAKGELRPQNYEETLYCIGCHSGIGAIADSTFVFQRKFDYNATMQGWYHWTQDANGLHNIKEPKTHDGRNEYQLYLQANHAGDEFRANGEVMAKFFDSEGLLKSEESQKIEDDISYLLLPSVQRAIELDKAYKIIVEEQSYIYGRDAHVAPVSNVHKEVTIDASTQIQALKY